MLLTESTWSAHAIDLVYKRYLVKEDISIEQWLKNVSEHICQNYSQWEKRDIAGRYFDMLYSRRFLPTSAALHNAYNGGGSLSGCIVIPLPKQAQDILGKTIPEISKVLLDGIGVGLDLSVLAPRLFPDPQSKRAHPGPVEMLKAITSAVEATVNHAGMKRAAFMALQLDTSFS